MIHSFGAPATTYPALQHRIPEEQIPEHRHKNPQTHSNNANHLQTNKRRYATFLLYANPMKSQLKQINYTDTEHLSVQTIIFLLKNFHNTERVNAKQHSG